MSARRQPAPLGEASMAERAKKTVTIKLTDAEADLVWGNVDGWIDAGSCEGGLSEDEYEALDSLREQIRKSGALERTRAARGGAE